MATIQIECKDPNDLKSLEEAMEKAAGRCNITYARQHEAMVEAGISKSQRESARRIAAETGETPGAVESRIRRGKALVRQPDAAHETRLEKEKARKSEAEKNRKPDPPFVVTANQAIYISALQQCIMKLPKKPPQQWNEHELTRATALAKIIVSRLSEFSEQSKTCCSNSDSLKHIAKALLAISQTIPKDERCQKGASGPIRIHLEIISERLENYSEHLEQGSSEHCEHLPIKGRRQTRNKAGNT